MLIVLKGCISACTDVCERWNIGAGMYLHISSRVSKLPSLHIVGAEMVHA